MSASSGPRILVVDDSALMRRALSSILEQIPGAAVRTARNGQDALTEIERWQPDVVTLDVNMPVMDGLTCLSQVMTSFPRPVVMVSSITTKDSEATLEALSMGAIDVIEKPDGTVSRRLDELGHTIRRTVRGAARAKLPAARARPPAEPRVPEPTRRAPSRQSSIGPGRGGDRVVVLGISTGGPNALEAVVPALPGDLPVPVVVAQHMPANFTASFASRLDARSEIAVVEARRTTPLEPGRVYIVHGGGDAVLRKRLGRFVLEPLPVDLQYSWHPSVERLAASALETYDPRHVLGVLMTGMGDDGARAMTELRKRGGHTIAESEVSAVVYGMPRELVERGGASEVVELAEVAHRIVSWAQGPRGRTCR